MNDQVINRSGEAISCQEVKFNEISCMDKAKVKELRAILHSMDVAKKYKKGKQKAIEFLDSIN